MTDIPILFDVDGVVLRHHPEAPDIYTKAIESAFRAFDVVADDGEVRSFVGSVSAGRMREICGRYGLDLAEFWPERERRVSSYQRDLCRRGERTLFEDVEVLPELAEDRSLAFVSNNQQATIEFILDHFGLGAYVETAYGREPTWDGFERRKPRPYYIRRALDDLGAETALYVGDRASDVRAAHRADLTAIYLRRVGHGEAADGARPDLEIQSLTELPDAITRFDRS